MATYIFILYLKLYFGICQALKHWTNYLEYSATEAGKCIYAGRVDCNIITTRRGAYHCRNMLLLALASIPWWEEVILPSFPRHTLPPHPLPPSPTHSPATQAPNILSITSLLPPLYRLLGRA